MGNYGLYQHQLQQHHQHQQRQLHQQQQLHPFHILTSLHPFNYYTQITLDLANLVLPQVSQCTPITSIRPVVSGWGSWEISNSKQAQFVASCRGLRKL